MKAAAVEVGASAALTTNHHALGGACHINSLTYCMWVHSLTHSLNHSLNVNLTHVEELEAVKAAALEAGASAAVTTNHHALGGAGALDLGEAVIKACNQQSEFNFLYDVGLSIKVWERDSWESDRQRGTSGQVLCLMEAYVCRAVPSCPPAHELSRLSRVLY